MNPSAGHPVSGSIQELSSNGLKPEPASVAVFGLGHVGLTLAVALADAGLAVCGCDSNERLIATLRKGESPFVEPGIQERLADPANHRLTFTSDPTSCRAETYVIAVGTPLLEERPQEVSLRSVVRASRDVGRLLKEGDLVLVRSTVPIGCTRDIIGRILERESGLRRAEQFEIVCAPERTAEGVALQELHSLPQIVGSDTREGSERAAQIFRKLGPTVIPVGSPEAAELAKLASNTYRDQQFAFANLISVLAERLDIDQHGLIEAINFDYPRCSIARPSPGVGGPCLSKDPYVLAQALERHELPTELILAARSVNENAPHLVVDKLAARLQQIGKSIERANITLVGMAFKGDPETCDLRNSPSIDVLRLLARATEVRTFDPVVPTAALAAVGATPVGLREGFCGADAVVVLNNHRSYGYWPIEELLSLMNQPGVFLDTWGRCPAVHRHQHPGLVFGD